MMKIAAAAAPSHMKLYFCFSNHENIYEASVSSLPSAESFVVMVTHNSSSTGSFSVGRGT